MELGEIEDRMIRAFRLLLESEEGRHSAAISRGELYLLWYIHRKADAVLPGELKEAMRVSTARIAHLLNALEARGYIRRSIDPADHRRVVIRLTEAGNHDLEQVCSRIHRRLAAIAEALGEEDTEKFVCLAEKIASLSAALSAAEREAHDEKANLGKAGPAESAGKAAVPVPAALR
ncbi:MAG: transcriptional regulator [Oscillospiraceae bacterium]|nr:transcriptional regulator [Oscillospiraceae bacterium]